MVFCFTCDVKLYGERTRVCSSITLHSNTPYPEKIAEIMGEDFLVVVTPVDHLCKKCSSLLTHMDKLEHDLKAVKNAFLSFIQKKYGILPADQPVKTIDVVNGNLKMDDVETSQGKVQVPSGLTSRDTPTLNSPMKVTKTVQPQISSKIKIYKCGFCAFQSKELGHVRFHMRSHMNQKGGGEITAQTGTKLLTQASSQQQKQQHKKRLYKCQVCSLSFESRQICLDHIQKNHNQQTAKEDDIPLETTKEIAEEDQQAGVSNMDMGYEQDKGAVNTDVLLNDDVSAEESQQETQNIEDHIPTQIDAIEIEQGTNIQKVGEDMEVAGENNKTGDLDIESMLAAIHQDTPASDVGVADNIVE